ncbi:MAG: hypothetical protein RL660_1890 [Bacteroidota bacterium]|jgi:hypothetical protein
MRLLKLLSALFLPFILLFLYIKYERWQTTMSYLGQYDIDLAQSRLNTNQQKESLDLKLSIYANGTFSYNKSVSYFRDSFGLWTIDFDKISGCMKLTYYKKTVNVGENFIQLDDSTYKISRTFPRRGQHSAGLVLFRKKE